MRRVRYQVAASLDGFFAGPNGEHDWIPEEPTYDFSGFMSEIDTVLMGRRSFQAMPEDGLGFLAGKRIVVFSKTLGPAATVVVTYAVVR